MMEMPKARRTADIVRVGVCVSGSEKSVCMLKLFRDFCHKQQSTELKLKLNKAITAEVPFTFAVLHLHTLYEVHGDEPLQTALVFEV